MSLIYWWPFTNDTIDKINGKRFTSTNWSFQSGGKIGNCFTPSWTDSNTISRQIYAESVSIPETFSVAVWVKNNNNFNSPRTYCPIQFSNGDCWLTGASNKGWDFSHNSLRLIFNNGSNVSGNAGNAEVNWGYNPREFLGNWYHIAFTVNKTTRKAELFINGVSKGIKDLPTAVDTYGGTFKLKINWVQGWMLDGSLNDLRIYDHALSQAEVKELSKALVVHYTFNDTCAELTTNIITGIKSAHGKSSLYGNGVKVDWSAGCADSYFMFNYSQAIKANSVYTLSFDCEGLKSGEVATFAVSNLSAASYNIALKNGRNSLTFTAGADLMNDINTHNRLFFDDKNQTNGAVFYLSNFQLEERDHTTPYTPTSRNSFLHNETGLIQPNTLNNVSLTTNSKSGTFALNCQGNTQIICTNTGDTTKGVTASFWVKCSIPSDSRLVFADNNSKIAFGFFNNGQAIITCAGYAHACVSNIRTNWNSEWNHIIVRKTSNGVVECYINGIKQSLSGSQEWTHSSTNSLSVGCRFSGGWTSHFTGLIDDFRYYNTCLSASDIAELYKTKAYITDQSDIMCGEFIEDKTDTMVTEKGTFECKEVYEKTTTQDFEFLDGILIEKNPYFDTGLVFSDVNKSIYVDAEVTPTNRGGNNCLAGSGNSSWNGPIMLNFCGGKLEFGTSGYSTSTEPQGSFSVNERLTVQAEISLSTQKWYKNNVQIKNITQRTRTATTATFAIGTFKTSSGTVGASESFKGYIHRFYVAYGDEVRCYLPAKRKSDNVYGLYDIHTKTFLVNSGGGTVSGTSSTLCDEAAIYQSGCISGREIIEL